MFKRHSTQWMARGWIGRIKAGAAAGASALALGLLALPAAHAAAFDAYLQLEGIPGESNEETHKDWIAVSSWAWGVVNTDNTPGGSGGGATGKAVFQDLSWTQGADKSIVGLFGAVTTGRVIRTATLDVVTGGDRSRTFFQMVFGEARGTSLQLSGSGSFAAAAALSYERVKLRYREANAQGGLGDWIEGSFDIKNGTATFSGNERVILGLLLAGGSVNLDAPVVQVPEPTSWALLAAGLCGLAWRQWGQRPSRLSHTHAHHPTANR